MNVHVAQLLERSAHAYPALPALARGERVIRTCAAPMSHGSGFFMMPHVAHAGLNVVPESGGFDPAKIYALVQARPGVTLFAAPAMVKRLAEFPGDADTRMRNSTRCAWTTSPASNGPKPTVRSRRCRRTVPGKC